MLKGPHCKALLILSFLASATSGGRFLVEEEEEGEGEEVLTSRPEGTSEDEDATLITEDGLDNNRTVVYNCTRCAVWKGDSCAIHKPCVFCNETILCEEELVCTDSVCTEPTTGKDGSSLLW